MPRISNEQLTEARKVDLLTYLQQREPDELVRLKSAPNEYRTKSHGSLVISNGAWYWNRGGFGGYSAIDYLVRVQGYSLRSAIEAVSRVSANRISAAFPPPLKRSQTAHASERKALVLQPRIKYPSLLVSYLQDRGIHADFIRKCLEAGTLYEGRYNNEPVCVFVGADDKGKARFACMRGIASDLKRDCAGSDKRFSFRIDAVKSTAGQLAVFESPIDALSHLTMYPKLDAYRLSLGGTSDVALKAFLESHPCIENISLCLDADTAGQSAARQISASLMADERYSHISIKIDIPPFDKKDFNEALLHAVRLERAQKEAGHKKEAGLSI